MREELTQENEIRVDGKYFVYLLDGDKISEVGADLWRARIGENEKVGNEVIREEILGALEKKKGGK